MILISFLKVTDIPSLTVETLSLCGRPTLTRSFGSTAINLTATGMSAKEALSPPQDGPPAQSKGLPSLPRERQTANQSTVVIQCHSVPTTMVAVTDCIAALLPAPIVDYNQPPVP